AKSGYINLLTSDRMNTKNPGDNKQMVNARSGFLDSGYYSHLRDCISSAVNEVAKDNNILLDAGCGEGYYTCGIYENALKNGIGIKVAGIDISKFAADKAAKRNKQIEFAVGSVFHIPFADNSCDILVNVFAPFCYDEYVRILKKGGYMIMAIPGKKHLWELKKAVYDKPYENNPKDEKIEGFDFVKKLLAKRNITLNSGGDIMNLFAMTPYFYNTSPDDRNKLSKLNMLETQTEFEVLIYRKKGE
ncbi:MAG: methyltransferase domain-containing protein, partial [Oscillospiraceae bacterium]|nr:methyltransferase domain-containing protein [Oscillospiraceae bacterium]